MHSMSKSISFNSALDGFWLQAESRGLSENTLNDYANTYRLYKAYIGVDTPVTNITPQDIQAFLAANAPRLKKKTLSNYHVGLSALWTWMVRFDLVDTQIVRQVKKPEPEKKDILPYSTQDIKAIMASLDRSQPYRRKYGEFSHELKHADRHRAMLFLLLDTGIRSNELCKIRIHDIDLRNRIIYIFGKGAKERHVPFSPRTGQVLWKYLTTERADAPANHTLFITQVGTVFNPHSLRIRISTICKRAGIQKPTVHRFRHTFAINYLRNGGNIYALQRILGHSTLEMVKRYLAIAQADIDTDHQHASPVANWGI